MDPTPSINATNAPTGAEDAPSSAFYATGTQPTSDTRTPVDGLESSGLSVTLIARQCFPKPNPTVLTNPVETEKWIVSVEGWMSLWFVKHEEVLDAYQIISDELLEDPDFEELWNAKGEQDLPSSSSTSLQDKKQCFKRSFTWTYFSRILRTHVVARLGSKDLWKMRSSETRHTFTEKCMHGEEDNIIMQWHDCARWQGRDEPTEDYLYCLRFLCHYRQGERSENAEQIAIILFRHGLCDEREYHLFKSASPSTFKACLELLRKVDLGKRLAVSQQEKRPRRSDASRSRKSDKSTAASSTTELGRAKRSRQDCESCFLSQLRALRDDIQLKVMHHQGVYPERSLDLSIRTH